jgi:hypothetical protein
MSDNAQKYREKLCLEACEGIDNAFLVAWNYAAKTNGGNSWSDRIDEMLSELFIFNKRCDELQAACDQTALVNGKLEQALKKYGHHNSDCHYHYGHDCHCGFKEIIANVGAK